MLDPTSRTRCLEILLYVLTNCDTDSTYRLVASERLSSRTVDVPVSEQQSLSAGTTLRPARRRPVPGGRGHLAQAAGGCSWCGRWGTVRTHGAADDRAQNCLADDTDLLWETSSREPCGWRSTRTRYMQSPRLLMVDRPFWKEVDPAPAALFMWHDPHDRLTRGTTCSKRPTAGGDLPTYSWMSDALRCLLTTSPGGQGSPRSTPLGRSTRPGHRGHIVGDR